MTLVNMKFSMSLRILGLDHYRFLCSCQAFAYIASRNTPFDPKHLSSRALLISHWFCHYNEYHFFHACLIINYHLQFLWQYFNIWDYAKAYIFVSFTIPWLVILNSTYINKLHLDIRINSLSLIHIPISMVAVAC